MLSNKIVSSEKITLVKIGNIVTADKKIVKVLNDFVYKINKTLNIPQTMSKNVRMF